MPCARSGRKKRKRKRRRKKKKNTVHHPSLGPMIGNIPSNGPN
jgi:hypothetical protein